MKLDSDIKTMPDYKVAETVDMPRLSLDMKPAEAIALAMKKEEEAMRMYLSLANHAENSHTNSFLRIWPLWKRTINLNLKISM